MIGCSEEWNHAEEKNIRQVAPSNISDEKRALTEREDISASPKEKKRLSNRPPYQLALKYDCSQKPASEFGRSIALAGEYSEET